MSYVARQRNDADEMLWVGARAPSRVERCAQDLARYIYGSALGAPVSVQERVDGCCDRLIALSMAVLTLALPAAAPVAGPCPGYEPGRWDVVVVGDLDHGQERRCKHCDAWESAHVEAPTPGADGVAEQIERLRGEIARGMAGLTSYDYDAEEGRSLVLASTYLSSAEVASRTGDLDMARAQLAVCDGEVVRLRERRSAAAAASAGPETVPEGRRGIFPPPLTETPSPVGFGEPRDYVDLLLLRLGRSLGRIPTGDELRGVMAFLRASCAELAARAGGAS